MIESVCLENGYYSIENGNVCENGLFKDGLHLQNSGKKILSQEFLCNFTSVRHFFRKTNMVSQYRLVRDSDVASATGKSNLQMLRDLRFDYPKNLLCGYLNINSLRNKIHELRLIIHDVPIDYFVISETKLDNSFPNAQLTINNYEIRERRDRDKHGRGLIEFVRKDLI